MITFVVEDVTEAKHRAVLNEMLAGELSYKARGKQKDAETFEIKLREGSVTVTKISSIQ